MVGRSCLSFKWRWKGSMEILSLPVIGERTTFRCHFRECHICKQSRKSNKGLADTLLAETSVLLFIQTRKGTKSSGCPGDALGMPSFPKARWWEAGTRALCIPLPPWGFSFPTAPRCRDSAEWYQQVWSGGVPASSSRQNKALACFPFCNNLW